MDEDEDKPGRIIAAKVKGVSRTWCSVTKFVVDAVGNQPRISLHFEISLWMCYHPLKLPVQWTEFDLYPGRFQSFLRCWRPKNNNTYFCVHFCSSFNLSVYGVIKKTSEISKTMASQHATFPLPILIQNYTVIWRKKSSSLKEIPNWQS